MRERGHMWKTEYSEEVNEELPTVWMQTWPTSCGWDRNISHLDGTNRDCSSLESFLSCLISNTLFNETVYGISVKLLILIVNWMYCSPSIYRYIPQMSSSIFLRKHRKLNWNEKYNWNTTEIFLKFFVKTSETEIKLRFFCWWHNWWRHSGVKVNTTEIFLKFFVKTSETGGMVKHRKLK